jgi:hypothetical protein
MDLDVVSGAIAVMVNLLLGSYSDFLGRRFVLLLPLLGHFLRNLTAPVIIYWDLGLPALYAGYVFDGLCGGSAGNVDDDVVVVVVVVGGGGGGGGGGGVVGDARCCCRSC